DVLGGSVTNTAGSGSVDKQDGPLRAARAGREHFVAVDDETAVDFLDRGSETNRLVRFARLWFAAPRDPFLTLLDHAAEPARLLRLGAHAVEQDERVNVTFPTARERHIDARDLFRHHPEREDVAGVWTKPVATVFFGHNGREQSRVKQVVEVFGGEGCGAIVLSRTRRKLFTRKHTHAIDQFLLLCAQLELTVGFVFRGDHFKLSRARSVDISLPVINWNWRHTCVTSTSRPSIAT